MSSSPAPPIPGVAECCNEDGGKAAKDVHKIFVGGLSQEVTSADLTAYFSKFGAVSDATVMEDHETNRSRGFGFLSFETAASLEACVADRFHTIRDKRVECKRATPRFTSVGGGGSRSVGRDGGGYYDAVDQQRRLPADGTYNGYVSGESDKIFVGGLPDLTKEEFRTYFEQFGCVVDAVLMVDRETNRPRGFGFITFQNSSAVDLVMRKYNDHYLQGKWVECKVAKPREMSRYNAPKPTQYQQGWPATPMYGDTRGGGPIYASGPPMPMGSGANTAPPSNVGVFNCVPEGPYGGMPSMPYGPPPMQTPRYSPASQPPPAATGYYGYYAAPRVATPHAVPSYNTGHGDGAYMGGHSPQKRPYNGSVPPIMSSGQHYRPIDGSTTTDCHPMHAVPAYQTFSGGAMHMPVISNNGATTNSGVAYGPVNRYNGSIPEDGSFYSRTNPSSSRGSAGMGASRAAPY